MVQESLLLAELVSGAIGIASGTILHSISDAGLMPVVSLVWSPQRPGER